MKQSAFRILTRYLRKPEEAVQMDPIDENMAVMYGKPIRAFPEQDHNSHIAVHMQFLQDPSLGGNPGAAQMQPILIAHLAEHIALLYRVRMEAGIGMEMPPLPDFKDPEFEFEDINPDLDRLISQRAAQVVQASPQMQPIPALQQAMQQGPSRITHYSMHNNLPSLKLKHSKLGRKPKSLQTKLKHKPQFKLNKLKPSKICK